MTSWGVEMTFGFIIKIMKLKKIWTSTKFEIKSQKLPVFGKQINEQKRNGCQKKH